MKKCYRCGIYKDLPEFHKDKYQKDGHLNRCKPCERVYQRETRMRNREVKRAQGKREYQNNKEQYALRFKKWHEKNSHKTAAHNRVKEAVARGDLLRLPCRECGEGNTDAHHEDYTKPLEVIWLCRLHHMQLHHLITA